MVGGREGREVGSQETGPFHIYNFILYCFNHSIFVIWKIFFFFNRKINKRKKHYDGMYPGVRKVDADIARGHWKDRTEELLQV